MGVLNTALTLQCEILTIIASVKSLLKQTTEKEVHLCSASSVVSVFILSPVLG